MQAANAKKPCKIVIIATKPNSNPSKDPKSVVAKVCLIASNIR